MNYNFPKSIFVAQNGIVGQYAHINTELIELHDAILHEPTTRVLEEALDLLHSVETLVRIIEDKYEVEPIADAQNYVERKNRARGYYKC